MSRRLAFVVVPLLLLGGFLALRAGLGSSGRGEPARVVGGGALAPGAPSAQEPAQMNSAELAEREASARALAGAQPERAEGDDFDRDRAVWIEGRVAFPVGSPPDDTLAVVAFALPEEGGLRSTMQPPHWQELTTRGARWSRTPVGGDGRFRAPLPEGTTRAQLLLDGRFLYLDEAPTVALPAAEPVALEPALGGCIVLRLTPPPAAEDGAARLAGAELRLFGLPTGSGFFGMGANGGARRETTLTEGTLAELRGLPGEHNYFLGADVGDFAPATLFDLELAPGATLERELAFELGARISGTVVDGGGAPVEGAEVSARLESQFGRMGMMGGGGERSATSDAEGRFELLGVQARRMKLRATKPDSIPAETEELRPRDGEVVRGLRLVLESGARIAGALSYDDGAPAAGALVTLTRAGEGQPTFGGRSSFQRSADDQGQFAVGGLEAGASYDVVAIAGRAPQGGLGATLVEAPADVFEDAPADVAAPGAPSRNGYRARREAVPAGTSGLELVLAAPPGLRGVVLDPDGQPLARYELTASLEESALGRSGRASVTVDDPGGRFLMEDVFAGEWRLSIEADGLVTAEEEPRVLVPHAGDLELRTLRAASVEGLVLDPTGAPVANAQIALTRGQSAPRQRGFMGFGGGRRDAVTDGEGRFYLRDRRPGPVTLRATHEEWAPSAELALELLPGVTHGEQVLQLGLGGTLTGEIYADGAPDAGRTIMIMSMAGGSQRSVTSDDGGRFRAEHLEAGQYTVMAQPRMSMLGEMAERDEDPDPVDFMSSMKMTSADVVEGGETHVVLGGAPKDPVRLFGRVTEGGEPVTEGSVMVVAEGRSLLEAWKPARIRDDGSYEIVLDEPGDVLVSYQDRAFQGGGTEFFVRVPEGESHRFDLELPTGRIEGVVLGPDGAPLDGVRVELERESGLRGVTMMGGQRGETTADGGRFAFTRVTPASYTLRAGGGAFGGDGYGTSLLSGVEVAPGGAALGLRIRLERPGVLRGRVLDSAGQPVAGASVFVRDAGGRLLSGFSTTATDGEGRFRRGNLAPGEVTVSARLGEEASREIGPLRIREGDETEVELSLEPGTVLRVAIEDGEGQAIRAGISVRDASGREFATLRSMDDMQSLMREGFSTTEQRFGPLPPGEYEVTATTQDGRSERRTLKLTGRAERKLRLRLDG